MSFPGRAANLAWHHIDAQNQVVGRLSTHVASLLRGKHKPTYHPNTDCGDAIVITNAAQVRFTGKKWDKQLYRWHTGYPGGLRQRTAKEQLQLQPTKILRHSILGMLRATNLRHRHMEKRLFIYPGAEHPHEKELGGKAPLPPVPRARSGKFHFGLYPHNEVVEDDDEEEPMLTMEEWEAQR